VKEREQLALSAYTRNQIRCYDLRFLQTDYEQIDGFGIEATD